METISLTEFNRNPSQAARLADAGDVLILRRGRPGYRLSKVEVPVTRDRIDGLLRSGLLEPARVSGRRRSHPLVETAEDLGSALKADRQRLDG